MDACPCSYTPSNSHPTSFLPSLPANPSFLFLHTWDKLACCCTHHRGHGRRLTTTDESTGTNWTVIIEHLSPFFLQFKSMCCSQVIEIRLSKGCSLCVYASLYHKEIQSSCTASSVGTALVKAFWKRQKSKSFLSPPSIKWGQSYIAQEMVTGRKSPQEPKLV